MVFPCVFFEVYLYMIQDKATRRFSQKSYSFSDCSFLTTYLLTACFSYYYCNNYRFQYYKYKFDTLNYAYYLHLLYRGYQK